MSIAGTSTGEESDKFVAGAWQIRLHAWIIQDGNYGNFIQGQTSKFAVNFFPIAAVPATESGTVVEILNDCCYRVNARVIYIDPKSWAIDFGLQAISDDPPPAWIHCGDLLSIDLLLQVDPYMYVEYLSKHAAMPPLVYHWRVEKILRQTAPFVKKMPLNPGIQFNRNGLYRDVEKMGFIEIERTNAWKDDGGFGEYTLSCRLLSGPSKE